MSPHPQKDGGVLQTSGCGLVLTPQMFNMRQPLNDAETPPREMSCPNEAGPAAAVRAIRDPIGPDRKEQ